MIENSLVKVWIKFYMGDEFMKEVKNNEKKFIVYILFFLKNFDKNLVWLFRLVFNCWIDWGILI